MPATSATFPGDPEFFYSFADFEGFRSVPRYALEDVTAAEFRDFLRILLDCPWRRTVHGAAFSPEAYLSFMRLATLWKLDAIREEVANSLFDVKNPTLKLLVGRRFDQKQLVPGALSELMIRKEPLEPEDYEMLGLDLAIRVVKCREHWRSPECGPQVKELQEIIGHDFAKALDEGEDLCRRLKRPQADMFVRDL
ncbi:hypothetical protein C8T65DRAFT_743312 [Cerioporus squamosus]|nr:hypothetical protein C8T65DRAFT_743312 [Cerioporus squamosus]